MTDTVSTNVIFSGRRKHIVQITNFSDGTGESGVAKIDKSGLATFEGLEPSKLVIEEMKWNIGLFTAVELYWDHDADDPIAKLTGNDYVDYRSVGGLIDPGSAGGSGDLILSTIDAAASATYDITISVRLKQ